MTKPLRKTLIALLVLIAAMAPMTLSAQTKTLAGHWEGAIELPGQKLAFQADFTAKPDGTWAGTVSIPAQNLKDYALAKIEAKGSDVSFEMPNIPGTPTFKGTLSSDGAAIGSGRLSSGLPRSTPTRRSRSRSTPISSCSSR